MSDQKLVIGGVTIDRGSNSTINIELPKLYNTPTQLPVRVIRGKKMDRLFLSAQRSMGMS